MIKYKQIIPLSLCALFCNDSEYIVGNISVDNNLEVMYGANAPIGCT